MILITDVHAELNVGKMQGEGMGNAFLIYVIALVDEQQVMTLGGVLSYYEFKYPSTTT